MDQAGFGYEREVWREVRPRIGERRPTEIAVRWAANTASPPRRKRWARRKVEQGHAVVLDLSISGARIELAPGADVSRHSRFELEVDGAWSTVQVAWIEPENGASARLCGVVFLLPSPEFIAAVSRVLDGRSADLW